MKNITSLIQKANRIGAFFATMPNIEEGKKGISDHIINFWDPRMRKAITNFLNNNPTGNTDDAQLSEIVIKALKKHPIY